MNVGKSNQVQLTQLQKSSSNYSILIAVALIHLLILSLFIQSKVKSQHELDRLKNIPVVNFLTQTLTEHSSNKIDFSASIDDYQDPGRDQPLFFRVENSDVSSIQGEQKKIRTGLMSNINPELIEKLRHPDAGEQITILKSNSELDNPATRYLNKWQQAIESSASIWFTSEQACLKGELIMSVSIESNGSLSSYSLLLPSSVQQLNQLAIDMIIATSPFIPFPQSLLEYFDRIEFVRKWKFIGNC